VFTPVMFIRYFALTSVLADSQMKGIMLADYFRAMSIAWIFVSIVSGESSPIVSN